MIIGEFEMMKEEDDRELNYFCKDDAEWHRNEMM